MRVVREGWRGVFTVSTVGFSGSGYFLRRSRMPACWPHTSPMFLKLRCTMQLCAACYESFSGPLAELRQCCLRKLLPMFPTTVCNSPPPLSEAHALMVGYLLSCVRYAHVSLRTGQGWWHVLALCNTVKLPSCQLADTGPPCCHPVASSLYFQTTRCYKNLSLCRLLWRSIRCLPRQQRQLWRCPPPKKIKVVHVVRAFDVCTSPTLV